MCSGSGIGFNVNQTMSTGGSLPSVNALQATGTGISYALSGTIGDAGTVGNVPGAELSMWICTSALVNGLCPAANSYWAALTTASGTVAWSSFIRVGAAPLTSPPMISNVLFKVTGSTETMSWDFCVDSFSL